MADNNNKGECPTIDESISLANEALEKAIETNDLTNAIKMLEPFIDRSLYHSSLRTIMLILNAGLTLNKDDLELATKSVDQTYHLSNRFRRTGFINSLVKMFKKPNYNKYSDLEIHAELTYAKFLGMSAILCALEANNIYSLIKIAFRLRLCVNAFQECRTIFRNRTIWESETSRKHFEAGVRLANGIQHLTISHIPPKLLKLVNFLGYKGVESRGFQELNRTAFELPGISSRIAQIVLLYYWVVAQPHACLGPKELAISGLMIDKELKKYPKALLFLLAKGKWQQISGNIDEAIETYNSCLIDNSLDITHKIFHIELCFCYALKCQWTQSIERAEYVRKDSIHSPAIITFIVAILRYAKSVDENDPQMKQMASELFRSIPGMRIRYFGKTITVEKIAVEKSKRYFIDNETLVLPELEFLNSANFLTFIKNNKPLLDKHLQRVNKFCDSYENDLKICNFVDKYLTALYYKAVLLRLMDRFTEAKECLQIILNEESRIEKELSLGPQTTLEWGLIEMALNNTEEAKIWLNKAIKDYSGYLNENYVHLRVFSALRELGVNTDQQSVEQSKINEYQDEWLKDLEIEENNYENILKNEKLVIL